jgi:hypothetical protein
MQNYASKFGIIFVKLDFLEKIQDLKLSNVIQNYACKFVIIFVEFISLKKYSLDAYDNL